MEEFGDVFELIVAQASESRHTFFGTAGLEERDKMLAMIVAEHNVGRNEARTFSAASLRSMTERTVLLKQRRAPSRSHPVWLCAETKKDARRSGALVARRSSAGWGSVLRVLRNGSGHQKRQSQGGNSTQ